MGAGGREEQADQARFRCTTTHALFARKVQRKVSNGVAELRAVRSFLDRQKSRQILWSSVLLDHQPPPRESLPISLESGPSCVPLRLEVVTDQGARTRYPAGRACRKTRERNDPIERHQVCL
jgi:hypothetical protein